MADGESAADIRHTSPEIAKQQIDVRDIEAFLVREAMLLDEWRLEEWLTLFEEGGRYLIPALDTQDGTPADSLFLVSDDWLRLQSRVKQLLGRSAWAESPRSRTCRLVTNFYVAGQKDDEIYARANFAIWRTQNEQSHTFIGRYRHVLVNGPTGLRFRERKALLNLDALRPHGKVSIIV